MAGLRRREASLIEVPFTSVVAFKRASYGILKRSLCISEIPLACVHHSRRNSSMLADFISKATIVENLAETLKTRLFIFP